MKHPIVAALCLAIVFIVSCTDVPLSFSTKITDDRIIGYWLAADSAVFQIMRNSNGTATMVRYEKNGENDAYKAEKEPTTLYFTSIADNAETAQFLSVESLDEHKTKYYSSAKFSFSASGDLITENINVGFLEKSNPKNESGLVTFGSPENYRAFVKATLKTWSCSKKPKSHTGSQVCQKTGSFFKHIGT
jgi:hypothetical protein